MERSGRNLSHVLMQEYNIKKIHTPVFIVYTSFISSKIYRLHAICVVCLFVAVAFPPAVLKIMFSLLGDIMSYCIIIHVQVVSPTLVRSVISIQGLTGCVFVFVYLL